MIDEMAEAVIKDFIDSNDDLKNIDKKHLKKILLDFMKYEYTMKKHTFEEINERRKEIKTITEAQATNSNE